MPKFAPRATAEQVSEGIDLVGRVAVVTGSSSGIGVETARVLALRGARVVMAVPDVSIGEKIKQEIVQGSSGKISDQQLEVSLLNLSSFSSVREFVARFLAAHDKLHLLINNAGIMAIPERQLFEGYEAHFATNYLGHFLLTIGLAPALVAGAPSRVVNVASQAHFYSKVELDDINFDRRPYNKWQGYGQSKTALILFARELNRKLSGKGVEAFSVHPGGVLTGIQAHMSDEEKDVFKKFPDLWKSVSEGASTSVYAATSPDVSGRGGAYLEDNDFAAQEAAPDPRKLSGQALHARDDDAAAALWAFSEKATAAQL